MMKAMVSSTKTSLIQCVLVGDGMVGKTCVIHAFLGRTLSSKYTATVFMDNYNTNISHAGRSHSLEITDLSIEDDLYLKPNCSPSNLVIVVCYSVVDRDSFQNIQSYWIPLVQKLGPKIPVVLVATQIDLRKRNNSDHVTQHEGKALCKILGINSFVECSAVKKAGIDKVFKKVTNLSMQEKGKSKKRKDSTDNKNGR